MLRNFFRVTSVLLLVTAGGNALAGPATQKMADCLVKQSTGQDRTDLMQWVVVGYSEHPDVAPVVTKVEDDAETYQRNAAQVFSKLLFEKCNEETRVALKEDGEIAMQNAFEALGRIAALELAQNQSVNEYLVGFAKFLDQKKIAELYD